MKLALITAALLVNAPLAFAGEAEFPQSDAEFKQTLAAQGYDFQSPVPARIQELPADNDEKGYDWKTYDAPVIEYAAEEGEKERADKNAGPAPAKAWASYDAPKASYWNSYDAPKATHWTSFDAQKIYGGGGRTVVGGLPGEIAAFLDTIAYAEGTGDSYNYIFTFATFNTYRDHPRRVICSGWLCSNAAGRYQFLAETWDPLARSLNLRDFSPLNQDKAALELIRRSGAYQLVANSSDYRYFEAALYKLNRIWASFPGSPYGQPTRSTAELWRKYRLSRAQYRSRV